MSMNILVAGATGKTGRLLCHDLVRLGHHVTALVRDSSDTSLLPSSVERREGDLTDLQDDACAGMDVVVFAAGSGSSTGPEMTDKVDRKGAMDLVDAAKKAEVARFVMLSSVGADNPDPQGDLAQYLKAKHDADAHLQASGLPYMILRPVALTDEGRSNSFLLGVDVDKTATASRSDVAFVLAQAAVYGTYDGQALDMQSVN